MMAAGWRKTPAEITVMARAGAIVARTLDHLPSLLTPGIATAELDELVRQLVEERGGELLFRDYHGFPGHCCISINDEVVHGIPGERRVEEGDIVTVDLGVRLEGLCADAARTYCVGEVGPRAVDLVACGQRALEAGIAAVSAGSPVSAIGAAVQATVEAAGYHVVTEYVGHGIGRDLHEEPAVPNHRLPAEPGAALRLEEGMVLAIEPMITAGPPRVRTRTDGWTVVTVDGGLAVHCEHTVAVEAGGARVLTVAPAPPAWASGTESGSAGVSRGKGGG